MRREQKRSPDTLAVATPMHMTEPVSEGTFRVVWREHNIQTIPARAPGRA